MKKDNNISYIFRNPFDGQFSIENVFNPIIDYLRNYSNFDVNIQMVPKQSQGIIPRLQIMSSLKRQKADIFHNTGDINFAHFFLKKNKVILTIHDCEFVNRSKGIKNNILKLFWLKLPIARANLITVISNSTKEEVLRYVKCNPNKIIVIPNPIREEYIYSTKEFNIAKPVILQIGTKENKNILRLIEALDNINCHFRVIGKLTQEQEEKLIKHNIDFSNEYNITDSKMLSEYHKADILTLVSTEEGFGLPILEANSIGRVVVTSNISSMPEVANQAACFVDPYDVSSISKGIKKVIHNKVFRDELISEGLENAKKYSIKSIASQYIELYDLMIQSK